MARVRSFMTYVFFAFSVVVFGGLWFKSPDAQCMVRGVFAAYNDEIMRAVTLAGFFAFGIVVAPLWILPPCLFARRRRPRDAPLPIMEAPGDGRIVIGTTVLFVFTALLGAGAAALLYAVLFTVTERTVPECPRVVSVAFVAGFQAAFGLIIGTEIGATAARRHAAANAAAA